MSTFFDKAWQRDKYHAEQAKEIAIGDPLRKGSVERSSYRSQSREEVVEMAVHYAKSQAEGEQHRIVSWGLASRLTGMPVYLIAQAVALGNVRGRKATKAVSMSSLQAYIQTRGGGNVTTTT
jgi:hypothetical protein